MAESYRGSFHFRRDQHNVLGRFSDMLLFTPLRGGFVDQCVELGSEKTTPESSTLLQEQLCSARQIKCAVLRAWLLDRQV